MNLKYAAILICLFFASASAVPISFNGINYDTDYLASNAIVIHFSSGSEPLKISYEQNRVLTGITEFDALNFNLNANSILKMFPGARNSGYEEMEGYYSVTFSNDVDLSNVIEAYRSLYMIDMAEPVPIHRVSYTPDDPLLGSQWGLTKIEAENAWNVGQGSADVVLAIADSGVDWDHPDLADDIWVNEDDPVDGQDNDGNGLVDDYIGWDWVHGVSGWPGEDNNYPDNDPMDFDGHGSHCAGIAAACTDNGVGVAGIGFDCKIMCLRVGWRASNGDAYVRMDFVAQAFYYAGEKSATAINCSWGSSYTNYLMNAVNFAVANGVVVVSAAGNENANDPPYLGTRTDVIAIAATNQSDLKADFSNYGAWVDVSAPGVAINSTYFDDTYTSLQGTSMAAPFVTGLAGLLAAAEPSLTRQEIIHRIGATADPIDDLNPDYAGMLGTGRINAYAALAAHIYPNFELAGFEVSLTDDDGDDILNPGESFDLVITLENIWADASSVTAIANSNDYFDAGDSVSSFGSIDHGQSADNSSQPFNLTADDGLIPGRWELDITVLAEGDYEEVLGLTIEVVLNQAGFPLNITGNIESSPLIFDFDSDNTLEIIFGTNEDMVYILEADGSSSAGWPQSVTADVLGGPAVGDIDDDNAFEVVVADKDGNIYAWEADGTVMTGFPVDIEGTVFNGAMLLDLDGDSDLEIVVGSMSARNIYIFEHTGESYGWTYDGSSGWFGTAAAVDLDGDSISEIIYAGLDSYIHAWDGDGSLISGFPVETVNPVYASAVAGNIDSDEFPEAVAVTAQGEVYLINHNGTIADNFPVALDATIILAPVMADITGDFYPEIILVDNSRNIHALNVQGQELSNFPVVCDDAIKSSPVVADLDGDGYNDIIVGCSSGRIHAYNHNGMLLANFPIGGENLGDVRGAPAIGDLDDDGDLEIVYGIYSSADGNLMVIDYKQEAQIDSFDWPNLAYDNHRGGCYPLEIPVAVDEPAQMPSRFELAQNYPNPFNVSTTISYTVPVAADVTIELFDILGRKVENLYTGVKPAGTHSLTWHADGYSSGIYFYRLQAGEYAKIMRCILIK